MIGASPTSARAIATRCCWPPDSWLGVVVGAVGEVDLLQRAQRAPVALAAGDALVHQRHLDVLQRGGPRQQVEALEHEADHPAAHVGELGAGQPRHVLAVEQVAAAGGLVEAAHDVHHRGLAGARRPHDRDRRAGVDRQVDAAQRVDEVIAHHVGPLDPAHLDQRRHQNAPSLRDGPVGTPRMSVMSSSPGLRSPSSISVDDPSVSPGLIKHRPGPAVDQLEQPLLVAELALPHRAAPAGGGVHHAPAAGPTRPTRPARPVRAGAAASARAARAAAAAPAAPAAELGEHRRELLARRLEPQRGVGDLDRVGDLGEHERDVGRHARAQRVVAVVDVDHGVVGHHALGRGRRVADLADHAVELPARERVDRERRLHALGQPADVALGDRGVDLHAREVLGDREQHRRLERRRHGLADVDRARQHDAVDRRVDRRVRQGELGLRQVGGGLGLARRARRPARPPRCRRRPGRSRPSRRRPAAGPAATSGA